MKNNEIVSWSRKAKSLSFFSAVSMILLLRFTSISGFATYGHRQHFPSQHAVLPQTQESIKCLQNQKEFYSSWESELLNECKRTTSKTINPQKLEHLDTILQRLNGPAPQSFYVLQRAVHRALTNGARPKDLEFLQTTAFFLVKRGYKFVLYNETKNFNIHDEEMVMDEGCLPWELVAVKENITGRNILVPQFEKTKRAPLSTLQIASQILDWVTNASEEQVLLDRKPIDEMVELALQQLSWTMGLDLRGRTSADAAFWFALSGVQEERLFQALATISLYEMLRVGSRSSLESKHVLQIVEKHAAAGTKGSTVDALYRAASDCLIVKREHLDRAEILKQGSNSFDLLSSRPLLWLWRFAARQKKAGNDAEDYLEDGFMKNGNNKAYPALPEFRCPDRPLVVDLGCGLGTSLLGLATTSDNDETTALACAGFQLNDCNYLGADLSPMAVQFASGVASRWNLTDRLAFSWIPAEECLDRLEESSARSNIPLIMIQFPAPYRLDSPTKTDGNAQLPADSQSGFMVSDDLLEKIAATLSRSGGMLLVQSNCEDVAVTVRNRAMAQHGMKLVVLEHEQQRTELESSQQTLRNLEWIRHGGERAIGTGWSSIPLLPERGTTETEVSCRIAGTPIHRCLLSA
jgi:SAM-dependent methyltransferase